jgi:hypothetical protein
MALYIFTQAYASLLIALTCPVEILPFHSRQKGTGISYIGNSYANLFNSLVTPVAIDAIGWKYYSV